MKKKIIIQGMRCEYCASQVHRNLRDIHGVTFVTLIFSENSALVEFQQGVSNDELNDAIEEAQCKVLEIKDYN